jgi:hypothetical protein
MTPSIRAILLPACLAALFAGCNDNEGDTIIVGDGPPPIPAGVYSVTGDETATVYWSPMVGADVRGYNVYASPAPDGPYDRIARVMGEASDHYVATGLDNGVTLYFAVDAFDFDGNTSDLSIELVHDTPRPAGFGLTLYAPEVNATQAAIDWSEYPGGNAALAVPWDDPLADFLVVRVDSVLYLKGTTIDDGTGLYRNDIQDFGFTTTLDEVDWAPFEGWSQSQEVELISGHSYIVWTWDDYYAKFRVTNTSKNSLTIEWAYQATIDYDNRFELAPGRKKAPGA